MNKETETSANGVRIDHLGIAVESIAEARGFYEALGLNVMHEETVEHEGVRVAMLPLGESRIELLEPLGPETTVGRFLTKRGAGLHHVALHVDDIAAAVGMRPETDAHDASCCRRVHWRGDESVCFTDHVAAKHRVADLNDLQGHLGLGSDFWEHERVNWPLPWPWRASPG